MAHRVQNPRPGQALARAYNLTGKVQPVIEETILPVALVDDLTNQGSLPLTHKAVSSFNQAAGGAGQFSVGRLEMPTGLVSILELITVVSATAGVLQIFFGSSIAVPANTATKAYTDGRLRSQGQAPAGVLTYGLQGGGGLATIHQRLPIETTGTSYTVEWPFGRTDAYDFIEFAHGTGNSDLRLSLQWREVLPA